MTTSLQFLTFIGSIIIISIIPSTTHSFQNPHPQRTITTTTQRRHYHLRRQTTFLHSTINNNNNPPPTTNSNIISDSYNLLVLGDLHLEDDLTHHHLARTDSIHALQKLSLLPTARHSPPFLSSSSPLSVAEIIHQISNARAGNLTPGQLSLLLKYKTYGDLTNTHLVSLGDLGRKDIRHEPGDAGTTKSFADAKSFFEGYDTVSYDVITGNHDLEGLDEFSSDEANLGAFMDCFSRDKPYFCRYVGEKTVLIGLSTVRFREAPYSSHEVHVDEEQVRWFKDVVERHGVEEGWKVFVFSHAPITGSGLRVLQNVHVVNGCAWLNHCSPNRNVFIETVKNNPQIKLWFSGHFHLSHDYQDALQTIGNCTFLQCGVVGPQSSRDGRRQTRLVQGNDEVLRLWTINHHKRVRGVDGEEEAELRLDAVVDLKTGEVERKQGYEDYDHDEWFSAYVPEEEDGCYIELPDGPIACTQTLPSSVCWWHMADGAVLGLHNGQLVEYDKDTLSPLGIVVNKQQLKGRQVLVVEEGTAVVMVGDDEDDVEVVHPNDDGSYWRKVQRNKRVRQEEKAREAVAKLWLKNKKMR